MGSKKKKSEKKKDFVKPKLKVGKTAPKASNHTDTSFVAKAISLPHQSLNSRQITAVKVGLSAEKPDIDLSHQLSLTKHHSATTRKEVLIFIEQHLPNNTSTYNSILSSITPLIIDQSASVRTTLVQLLNSIAKKQPGLIELHARSLVLFIHSAMTHIQPPIRNDSTKFLEILIDHGFDSLVKSSFVKTLRAFCQIMNWQLDVNSKKSLSLAVNTSTVSGGGSSNARISHLHVLQKFLEKSVFATSNDLGEEEYRGIHPLTHLYMAPTVPQAYANLKLFVNEMSFSISTSSQQMDLNSIACEDVETRRRILVEYFEKPISKGLSDYIKEGGELGKASTSVANVVSQLRKDEAEFSKQL